MKENEHAKLWEIRMEKAGETAEVERATDMHGFKLKAVTEKHIVLQAENPENRNLYEISFFNPRLRGFWGRKYAFSTNSGKG